MNSALEVTTVDLIFRGGQVPSKWDKYIWLNYRGPKSREKIYPTIPSNCERLRDAIFYSIWKSLHAISVVGKVPTKCPIYWSDANSLNVVGTLVPCTIKKEKQ